jgi:hypothetical protein
VSPENALAPFVDLAESDGAVSGPSCGKGESANTAEQVQMCRSVITHRVQFVRTAEQARNRVDSAPVTT